MNNISERVREILENNKTNIIAGYKSPPILYPVKINYLHEENSKKIEAVELIYRDTSISSGGYSYVRPTD